MQMNVATSKRTRRHVVYAAIISILAVVAGYMGVLPVFRSHFMAYLGIGDGRLGLLFGLGSLTGLTSVLLGGQLIDRWGPRRVIRVCLTGIGYGMLIVSAAGQRYGGFVCAVMWTGFFTPPMAIAISAYLGKLFPRHRRRVVSLNLASTSFGGMMFPLLAEGLLRIPGRVEGITFGHVLHIPFFFMGSMLIGASFLYHKQNPPAAPGALPTGHTKSATRWHWRDLLLPPRIRLLALLITLHGVSDTTLHVWMPRFLESRSFDQVRIAPGIVLSGFALSYLLARLGLALLPDRIGKRAFLILPGILGGGLLMVGILSRNDLLTAGGYVLGALLWSVEYPTLVSTIMLHYRRRFGAAMAFSGLLTGLSLFAAMNGMGAGVQHLGEERMWLLMLIPAAGFVAVGIGGAMWLLYFERQTIAPAGDTSTAEDM